MYRGLIHLFKFTTTPKMYFSILNRPFTTQEQFLGEIGYILYKIEQSFTKLKEFEDRIAISPGNQSLNVQINGLGEYNFTTNLKERRLYLQTPFNLFQYYYDESAEEWRSVKDHHNMIENLTRETGKYLKGYLDF